MKEGYYWVKWRDGGVQIALMFKSKDWKGEEIDVWLGMGRTDEYGPEDIEHIGPRIKQGL